MIDDNWRTTTTPFAVPTSLATFPDEERVELQQRIEHLCLHDSLTGLPNRSTFWDKLQQMMASPRRTDSR